MAEQSLQELMLAAIQQGDVKAQEDIAKKLLAGAQERRKVEVEAQRKESEALAGAREALATAIHEQVKALKLDKSLKDMRAWGFTYKVDRANPNEPDVEYKSVSLSVTAIKERKASSGNGGGAGKTKDEYGLSLGEVFERFANDDDRGKLAEAEASDKVASEKLGHSTNSNAWRIKNQVKKRALADGLLAPTK